MSSSLSPSVQHNAVVIESDRVTTTTAAATTTTFSPGANNAVGILRMRSAFSPSRLATVLPLSELSDSVEATSDEKRTLWVKWRGDENFDDGQSAFFRFPRQQSATVLLLLGFHWLAIPYWELLRAIGLNSQGESLFLYIANRSSIHTPCTLYYTSRVIIISQKLQVMQI